MAGKICPNGVVLMPHEMKTVVFLTDLGYDVELIPKSNIEGQHSADIIIDGISWEIKSPTGETKNTMKNNIQSALKQSNHIIIDLRRINRSMDKCIREIRREFDENKKIEFWKDLKLVKNKVEEL